MIVVLVGGNQIYTLERDRDEQIGTLIREASKHFWRTIADNVPPAVDYARDADLISRLYGMAKPGSVLDATLDESLTYLVGEYDFASREIKSHESLKAAKKAQILERIGDAEKVIGNGWSISAGMVKDSPGTLITPEMVGTHVGSKKGYRGFRPTLKKGEK